MKKLTALMLSILIVLFLAACGSPEQGSKEAAGSSSAPEKTETAGPADPSAESEETQEPLSEPVVWNKTEDLKLKFEETGKNILLQREGYMVSFDGIRYRQAKKNDETFYLYPQIGFKNDTGSEISLSYMFTHTGKTHLSKAPAGESRILSGDYLPADQWNGLVGETEDCYLSTCVIKIYRENEEDRQQDEILDVLSFDIYISEKAPFKNVGIGTAATADLLKSRFEPLYHTENDLISVDIVKVLNDGRSLIYVASNRSGSTVYTKKTRDYWPNLWTAEMMTAEYDARRSGESWYEIIDLYKSGVFEIDLYNAICQNVGTTALRVLVSENEKGVSVGFEQLFDSCDVRSTSAYPDLTAVKPVYTAENKAARSDLLAVYIESGHEFHYNNDTGSVEQESLYRGMALSGITNLSDRTLYFYQGKEIAPGETVYSVDCFASGEGRQENASFPVNTALYIDDAHAERAVSIFYRADWVYDTETGTAGVSNFDLIDNKANEEVLTGIYYSFYTKTVISETQYYTLMLRSMSRQQDDNGVWHVRAELELTNTSGSRYLTFDPGKQFAGYDPGADWFKPDDTRFYHEEFTGKDEESLTGKFLMKLEGYSWNGQTASKLFEDTVNFTLRFDKKNPVSTN